jgi:hypothetical protein
MARLMKSEGKYLLIAKILVVARLVHKALGQSKEKPAVVERVWEKVLSMRRKLLRRIHKRLASTTGETTSLVESMCAYALATSSAPSDVLQHFLKVRMEKMGSELKRGDDELAKHGIRALKLCIQTCSDTQTIFPRRLAEGLVKLKAQPLIQDPDVRGLDELNLDVHDRWLGDEARNYTPWPRHDEMQRTEAEKILHRWSKDAISAFLQGIRTALGDESRLKEVAHLRQELIETWILSGSRMAGVKSSNVLDDFRDTMNQKLGVIVWERTQGLGDVALKLKSQLDNLTPSGDSAPSLWSTATQSYDLGNGAHNFKTTILNTYQGRDQHVNDLTSAFDKWMDSVLEVKGIVKSMKEARWDDTFADDVDSDSDSELGDSKQTLLSDDDPRALEEATQDALAQALQELGINIAKVVDTSLEEHVVHKTVFILRVIRDLGDRIPLLKLADKSTPLASPFQAATLRTLHAALATHIAAPRIRTYEVSLAKALETSTNSHVLWEGTPPLPSQPSPSAFRFLRELNRCMTALGADLWAPECVAVLKKSVGEGVERVIGEAIKSTLIPDEQVEEEDENAADDESEPKDSATSAKDGRGRCMKQLIFDALYLQRFVATSTDTIQGAGLDGAAMARLKRNAAEHAKKTYLLFALLA